MDYFCVSTNHDFQVALPEVLGTASRGGEFVVGHNVRRGMFFLCAFVP
jgi:hypothetical protein